MRTAYGILALLFTLAAPTAVEAQLGPPVRAMAPQTAANARGITVNGSASTHVPATKAQLTLMFVTRNGKLALNAQTLQPVIDALVASGIPREGIQIPINLTAPGNTNNASVTGTVDHPNAEMLKAGVLRVGTAIASMPDVILNSATVRVSADACAAVQDTTRGHAIENAHAKAAAIAKQLGVKLGGVLAVNAYDPQLTDGACSWQYYIGAFSPNGPMSADDYVTVPVTSNVTITYGIK